PAYPGRILPTLSFVWRGTGEAPPGARAATGAGYFTPELSSVSPPHRRRGQGGRNGGDLPVLRQQLPVGTGAPARRVAEGPDPAGPVRVAGGHRAGGLRDGLPGPGYGP